MRELAAARAELEPVLREQRRRTVALLDDPRCTSCASVLGRAQSLELGADYGKVGRGAGPPISSSSSPHRHPQNSQVIFHPKVPSVEKVLKALAGLPRSDFAEMIRQVLGVGVQPGWVWHPEEVLSTPSFLAGQRHLQLHPGTGCGEDGAAHPG